MLCLSIKRRKLTFTGWFHPVPLAVALTNSLPIPYQVVSNHTEISGSGTYEVPTELNATIGDVIQIVTHVSWREKITIRKKEQFDVLKPERAHIAVVLRAQVGAVPDQVWFS